MIHPIQSSDAIFSAFPLKNGSIRKSGLNNNAL